MRLVSFSVKGYRSLRSVHFDLGQVTVFVRENGAGKSNLYRALQLVKAAAASTNRRASFWRPISRTKDWHRGLPIVSRRDCPAGFGCLSLRVADQRRKAQPRYGASPRGSDGSARACGFRAGRGRAAHGAPGAPADFGKRVGSAWAIRPLSRDRRSFRADTWLALLPRFSKRP